MRNLKSLGNVLLLIMLLSGCSNSSGVEDEVSGKGLIRGLHAIADLGPVTFLIEESSLGSVDFKEVSGISEFDDLNYNFNFDILLPDNDEYTRMASREVSVVADTEYTFVLTGSLDAPEIVLWEQFSRDWDPYTEEASENDTTVSFLDVAFGHAAASLGTIDVFLAEPGVAPSPNTLAASLSFGEFQESIEVSAGTWQVVVTDSGTTEPYLFASTSFTLTGATDISIAIVDGDDSRPSTFSVRLIGSGTGTELVDINAVSTLRAVHAANNTDSIDIVAGDDFSEPMFSELSFGQLSGDVVVLPGEIDLNITPAGNPGSFIAEETIEVASSLRYWMYLTGLPGQLDGVLMPSGTRRLSTHAKFRYYQGAARFSSVDTYLVAAGSDIALLSPLISGMAYTGTTGYYSIIPGDYDLVLTQPGTKTVVAGPLQFDLAAGSIHNVISADSLQTDVAQLLHFED